MKKIKVIIKEWECKEVEYICEVEDKDLIVDDNFFGIGEIESLGDMSDSGGDAMGFYCKDISKKTIKGSKDFDSEILDWHEIEEGEAK